MSTLNLFPARVPIGKVRLPNKPDGTQGDELNAFASMEFLKALKVLFDRVGGANGAGNSELIDLITQLLMTEAPISPAPEYVEPVVDYGPQVAALTGMVDEVRAQQDGGALFTEVAALRQQVEQLANLIATPGLAPSYADFLQGYAEPQTGADWEHPGKIGARTASSGAFTTLSASGAVALSPANANVVLSPTGTGLVTIAPATAGAIDNVNIGATTRGTVAGTTGNFNAGMTLSGGVLTTLGGATFHTTSTALTDGAAAGAGTIANAPAAGNPSKWIGINDNGTTRYIPAW